MCLQIPERFCLSAALPIRISEKKIYVTPPMTSQGAWPVPGCITLPEFKHKASKTCFGDLRNLN